jgi:hypothetical protein
MMRLALKSVPTEDLLVFWEMCEPSKKQTERTERESAAMQAVSCAYDRAAKEAGYPSIAAFQEHADRLLQATYRRR